MGNPKNLEPAKKGEIRNPKGRPKKFAHALLDELKEQGYTQITKTDITNIYTTLIALNATELSKIKNDNDAPVVFTKIASAILSKEGFDIIERMLDRAHGKATSNSNNSISFPQMPKLEWGD